MFKYLFTFLCAFSTFAHAISPSERADIAHKIFLNEASGKKENLIVWNNGENFPSLGIGHFIWYKYKEPERFEETFPKLVEFYKANQIKLPKLLRQYRYAPWKTQQEFLIAKKNSADFKELQDFLYETQPIQIKFIAKRLEDALPKLLSNTQQKDKVHQIYTELLNHPQGLYALIDYINFKGEGINPNERYNNQGWGLLQVIENMPNNNHSHNLLKNFSESAKNVLLRRIQNAPNDETRWQQGWLNRVSTYQ